jgi:hypothetical protein
VAHTLAITVIATAATVIRKKPSSSSSEMFSILTVELTLIALFNNITQCLHCTWQLLVSGAANKNQGHASKVARLLGSSNRARIVLERTK